jgi:hypothetical protein
LFDEEENMARNQLKNAAKKIGAAMGKADRTAHKVAKAGIVARQELIQLSKQVESLKRQLQKTTKRLKNALT